MKVCDTVDRILTGVLGDTVMFNAVVLRIRFCHLVFQKCYLLLALLA